MRIFVGHLFEVGWWIVGDHYIVLLGYMIMISTWKVRVLESHKICPLLSKFNIRHRVLSYKKLGERALHFSSWVEVMGRFWLAHILVNGWKAIWITWHGSTLTNATQYTSYKRKSEWKASLPACYCPLSGVSFTHDVNKLSKNIRHHVALWIGCFGGGWSCVLKSFHNMKSAQIH